MWTTRVDAPFRDDPRFWRSVGASVDALVALVAAVLLVVLAPGWTAVAFAVPVLLLVRAWVHGRASSALSKPQFASLQEWRDRERDAVAAAIPGAFLRHARRGGSRP